MPAYRDRRRAQAGTTLVELLVSVSIISLALTLVVGLLSTGALNATLAKRNTAVEAAVQFEMESIGASAYDPAAPAYSDCFAVESPTSPASAGAYQGACPGGSYSLRADITWSPLPTQAGVQVWTISVTSLADGSVIGNPVTVYKVAHQ